MNNDQEQDRGEFAPAPTVFNDLTSLKYKQTVGPIESGMREQRIQDGDLMNIMRQDVWNTQTVLVEDAIQRMTAELKESSEKVKKLEKIIANQEAMLERQTARIVDLKTHIENLEGGDS